MDQPLVTIITVTYNSSAFAKDAIDSVLSLSYPNIEYIVGDDCSADDTWEIICGYDDPRIRAYRNPANIGEYPNRNKAIAMASGKYLMFIDGDDVIYPHAVSYYVEMMERFPDAAIAIQKTYLNNLIFPVLLSPAEILTNFFFGKTPLISTSLASNFFRTGRLKAAGGFAEKYRAADEEIRLRLACTDPFLLVQGWVTWPRETPGSASVKIRPGEGLSEVYRILLDLQKSGLLARPKPGIDDLILRRIRELIRSAIFNCLKKGDFRDARSLMKKNGLKWLDLRTADKGEYPKDFLAASTPASPYKQQL